jgi:hypothetical protein
MKQEEKQHVRLTSNPHTGFTVVTVLYIYIYIYIVNVFTMFCFDGL